MRIRVDGVQSMPTKTCLVLDAEPPLTRAENGLVCEALSRWNDAAGGSPMIGGPAKGQA